MAKWIPTATLDLQINEIAESDGESVCSDQPATYFNACHPDIWVHGTVYDFGDLVRPPTTNGYIYECVVGGTSGLEEPGWGTVQDGTFTDGTVTWKTHENYSLIYTDLESGDRVIEESIDPAGRKLTIAQKMGIVTHRSGTVSHTALISNADKKLHLVTTAGTTLEENNDVISGRTTILFPIVIIQKYPI